MLAGNGILLIYYIFLVRLSRPALTLSKKHLLLLNIHETSSVHVSLDNIFINNLVTPTYRSERRLCFYRRVSFILFNGGGEEWKTIGLWTTPHSPPRPGHNTSLPPPPDMVTTPPPRDMVTTPPPVPPGPGHNTSLPPPRTWSQHLPPSPPGPAHNTSLPPSPHPPPRYYAQTGGMHPTGMYSCWNNFALCIQLPYSGGRSCF